MPETRPDWTESGWELQRLQLDTANQSTATGRRVGSRGGSRWMRAVQGTSRHWIDRPAKNRGKEKVDPPPFRLDIGTLGYVPTFSHCAIWTLSVFIQQSLSVSFHYQYLSARPVQVYKAQKYEYLMDFQFWYAKGLGDDPASCQQN